ncbi:MAG: glycosyl hydrolase family 38, partial [Turicibacter sp.]
MSEIKLNKKWEVLLLHHTHTDIGYTQSQETIEFYHVNFIKQAIEIAEGLRAQGKEHEFTWVCEAFWGIENFLKSVDNSWKNRFETCVKNGSIEVTGSYLNMTELIDDDVLRNQLKKSVDYGKSIGLDVKCAMTADINGYSWGLVDALYENGIENLLSCVHSHHGMYPLFKKQTPFYWESEKGNKVLVWNGEHYHFGNEFGMVKTATGSYVHKDELRHSFTQDKLKEYGQTRMFRYLKALEDQDYEYDFVPITVHGLPTDNGSANIEVLEFVSWWNENFGEEITIKMATLEEFFDKVKTNPVQIPTYRGDWPDWWAFGVGSTPHAVKVYKEGQRLLSTTKLLDTDFKLSDLKLVKECEDMLALYAEHTWGHSSSLTNPWNSFVNLLDAKKSSYASRAHEMAIRNYTKVLEAKGMTSLKPNREPKFKIVNPHDRNVCECVKLSLDYWETSNMKNIVVDELGNEYVTQIENHPRGEYINFIITLAAHEERTIYVKRCEHPIHYIKIKNESACIQGYDDIFLYDDTREVIKYNQTYENKHVKISWDKERGIIGWYDKVNHVELFDDSSKAGAFMPVYELTKGRGQTSGDQYAVRSSLGRNMRGANHEVFYPTINSITV